MVEEEATTASSVKSQRTDERPLDKISLLSDWTAVSPTDHDADQASIDEELDLRTGELDAVDSSRKNAREDPDVEPVSEDAIAGAKVRCSLRFIAVWLISESAYRHAIGPNRRRKSLTSLQFYVISCRSTVYLFTVAKGV